MFLTLLSIKIFWLSGLLWELNSLPFRGVDGIRLWSERRL